MMLCALFGLRVISIPIKIQRRNNSNSEGLSHPNYVWRASDAAHERGPLTRLAMPEGTSRFVHI